MSRGDKHSIVGLLAVAVFMTGLDMRVVAPLLPAIAGEFDVSVAAAGLVITAHAMPYALCQLGYGPLGDRVGRLKVITWTFALFAVGAAISGLAPTFPALLGLRFLAGTVAAATFPLALAHISDTLPYARRQAAFGVLISAGGVAQILSVSIGGMIGEFLSWRLLYISFGLLSAVVWVFLYRALRQTAPPQTEERVQGGIGRVLANYAALYRTSAGRTLYGLVFVECFFILGGFPYIGAAIHQRFDVSLFTVGLLLAGYGLGALVSSQLLGRLVRRFGEQRLVWGGGLLMSGGFLLAEITPWWQVGFLAAAMMGLGFPVAHTTLQARISELAPRARGGALALHAFHTIMGQATGAAALGGLLALTGGYNALLLSGAVGLAVWTVAATLLLPAPPRPSANRLKSASSS